MSVSLEFSNMFNSVILKIGKIRPEERKWRLGAKLNLRPRCPDSQFRTLNATPYLR